MLNRICLMGRVVHNPELKSTSSGASVTTFAVAVERSRAGQDGKRPVDYIDVVAWRNTAEFVCKYFQKGSWIVVEGSLQTRTYEDKEGKKRKVFEVLADNVHFGGSKSEASRETQGDADDSVFIQQRPEQLSQSIRRQQPQQINAFTQVMVDDDELPF